MVDWDAISEKRPTINVTVRDTVTKDLLATVNGLPIDQKISFLHTCICREAGLPCRPLLQWNGKALLEWETIEEIGVPDGAEIPATMQQALVTASHDGTAKIWNMETGECETTLTGHNGKVLSASFSPDGRRIVTASEDKTAKVWNTLSGHCERTLQHSDSVYSATFSDDGKLVATASEDNTSKVFVVKTGNCRSTLRGHSDAVFSVQFDEGPNGQVMTESRDGTTRLWNRKTGVCDRTLQEQSDIYHGSYSPSGLQVATTPGDNTALILDVQTGEVLLTLMGHEDLVIAASYCAPRPKPETPKRKPQSVLSWKNAGPDAEKGDDSSSAADDET
jgi:WD40 repeat protein